jgi:hypothetical protein
MTQQVQPIVNIQFTPAGAELMINALRKLPHEQVHELVEQTFGQYKQEAARLQAEFEATKQQSQAVTDVEPKAE